MGHSPPRLSLSLYLSLSRVLCLMGPNTHEKTMRIHLRLRPTLLKNLVTASQTELWQLKKCYPEKERTYTRVCVCVRE